MNLFRLILYIFLKIKGFISRADMAANAVRQEKCRHVAMHEPPCGTLVDWGKCVGAHVCARVCACAPMCVNIVSGLSILFKT